MEDLSQSLIEALKSSLPEMQVKAVVERLKEYGEIKKKIESSENLNKYYQEENSKLNEQICELQKSNSELSKDVEGWINREKELVNRELTCESKERNWELEKTKIQLDAQKEINAELFNVTSQVFHSPVYQTTQNGFVGLRNPFGGYDQVPFEQITRNECVAPVNHTHIMDGNNSGNIQGRTGHISQ